MKMGYTGEITSIACQKKTESVHRRFHMDIKPLKAAFPSIGPHRVHHLCSKQYIWPYMNLWDTGWKTGTKFTSLGMSKCQCVPSLWLTFFMSGCPIRYSLNNLVQLISNYSPFSSWMCPNQTPSYPACFLRSGVQAFIQLHGVVLLYIYTHTH